MARTTISLNDGLLREARRLAHESGVSLARFIEDAVREVVARRRSPQKRKSVKLPTSPGAPLPGVDLDDSSALLDLMERR